MIYDNHDKNDNGSTPIRMKNDDNSYIPDTKYFDV